MTAALPAFLTDASLKLLIFGGKGGVGKTTSATATALHLASTRPTARVLLLSTDPAHSVADCLAGEAPPTNLCVIELSAEKEHAAFMERHAAHLKTIASRGTFLDGDDIDRFIELSVPGMDELMAFLRIAGWVAQDSFDVIVVDTAPSGHTLRLLAMSDLLTNWLEALDALLAKHRYMASLFSGRRKAPADSADTFLDELREQIETLTELLSDETRCRFVPVMLAEPMSVSETCDVVEKLDELDVAAPDIIVNRLLQPGSGDAFAPQRALQRDVLSELPHELSARALWGAPLAADEMRGVSRLARFVTGLTALDGHAFVGDVEHTPGVAARCEGIATLPPPSNRTQLLFFAGKGGVGKTTMAAAAAVRLASCGRRTLIVSTDPAHSLGDCLRVELGDDAQTLAPALDALEIDAAHEFDELREQYQDELEAVLESMFESVDLSFDREAMERLLDLAPPGLDECMALLRILDQLDRERDDGSPAYDCIVVDTAPTGHLLRLLELPELIEQWLSSLFAIFIKYDNIFRLPKLQARLVTISRGIKKLRATLADDTRCRVQVVSILTEMAFAEASDLIGSLRKMHVGVGNLFLNLALLEDQSELGIAVRSREAELRAKYAAAFRDINQVLVYRAGDPRGLANLALLATELYAGATAARMAA